jgi:hypothetical protein
MTRTTRWLGGSLAVLAGCDPAGDLGTIRARDAGVEAAVPAPLSCLAVGGAEGLRDEVANAAPVMALVHDEPAPVGTGHVLRAGGAVNVNGAVYWSVGDDRCGESRGRLWWGARVLQLSFDPDRAIRTDWTCLPNTYPALDTAMLRVGDQLGVFYTTHIEATLGAPNDYGYNLGTLTRPPMAFSSTQNVLNTRRAAAAAFGDGAHVVYADNEGRRFYQRVDGALMAAGDPSPIEGESIAGLGEPLGPVPWGDAMLAFWGGAGGEAVAEVFTAEGQRRELWSLRGRTGLREPVTLQDVRPVAGGVAALLRVGAGASGRGYFARFCEDGRWAMRRVGGDSVEGVLRRINDRWIVVTVAAEDGGRVARLLAVDDDGRRLGPPLVVDRARTLELGDVAQIPSTQDVVVLYAQQAATSDPWQLRATRVARAD